MKVSTKTRISKKKADPPQNGTPAKSVISIPAPQMSSITLKAVGISPLIVNKFSEKSQRQIEDNQQGKGKVAKGARKPKDEYEGAFYVADNGGYGFPASAFKLAMVSAGSLLWKSKNKSIDGKMVMMSVFIRGKYLKIKGKPHMATDTVRLANGSADVRYRPQFDEWQCELIIDFNEGVFTKEAVVNLLAQAGQFVGVGDWRPEKRGSNGRFNVTA